MGNSQLRTYSVPTVIVPAIKAAVFPGTSAATFAVAAVSEDDRILFVHSVSSISAMPELPIVGLGDAYNEARSSSSASVVGDGIVGLDYSTASYFNTVYYVDSDGATIS